MYIYMFQCLIACMAARNFHLELINVNAYRYLNRNKRARSGSTFAWIHSLRERDISIFEERLKLLYNSLTHLSRRGRDQAICGVWILK